jgi:hypothetical protein
MKSPCLTCERSGEDKVTCSKDCKLIEDYRKTIVNPINVFYTDILKNVKGKIEELKIGKS